MKFVGPLTSGIGGCHCRSFSDLIQESAPHVPDGSMVIVWTASKAGLPESEVTIGEVAKSAGYRTGYIGKWHLGFHCPGKLNCHSPTNQVRYMLRKQCVAKLV